MSTFHEHLLPGTPFKVAAGPCSILQLTCSCVQSLSQACNKDPQCTGFVYKPAATNDPSRLVAASGWLKTGGMKDPMNPNCTSLSTFLTTYKRDVLPAPKGPDHTAAIVGGVCFDPADMQSCALAGW